MSYRGIVKNLLQELRLNPARSNNGMIMRLNVLELFPHLMEVGNVKNTDCISSYTFLYG